jgi:hypothetical protein
VIGTPPIVKKEVTFAPTPIKATNNPQSTISFVFELPISILLNKLFENSQVID